MLFSEPKISQCRLTVRRASASRRFSALQRAENFSIALAAATVIILACFSALQRAENFSIYYYERYSSLAEARFSALQRAENFSIDARSTIA